MSDAINCESRISRVVVYARGAVVTRRVELPVGLPAEACVLHVDGITPMAEPDSVRTEVDGERRITGVQAPLVWQEAAKPVDLDQQAITRKQREVRRNSQRRERVRYRIQLIESIGLSADLAAPEPDENRPHVGIADRLGASLAASDLIAGLLKKLDAELRKLDEDAQRLNLELHTLRSRPQPARSDQPHRRVVISLAAGSEHLRTLEFSYNVKAARWWPAYSARLSNGGKNAEFSVEAFVAQNTLEDWLDAQVSLCTADMISDVTLPELQSLRLGRSQPPRATGFREPPEGLDAMFRGNDEAFGSNFAPPTTVVPSDIRVFADAPQPSMQFAPPPPAPRQAAPASGAISALDVSVSSKSAPQAEMAYDEGRGEEEALKRREKVGRARSAPAKAGKKDMSRDAEMDDDMAYGGEGAGAAAPAEYAPEPEPEAGGVADAWLDFDALILADNSSHRRGRLMLSPAPHYQRVQDLNNAIEYLGAPAGTQDPLYSRGLFDHRYDADGIVEIPSTGTPHRIRLLAKPAKSRMTFRCVPLEDERVFREVEIENPLEAPLIGGPIDVFMDGALLITSAIGATDLGGVIRFGLGEEQRVRVARNVRAREESKGMFKGGTAMDHNVSLEAASSLAGDIELELVDRIPIGNDKDIKVELASSNPKPERYNQQERNNHVGGGLRWKIALKAGATAKVEFTYRIGFDKDFELVGGNRRA